MAADFDRLVAFFHDIEGAQVEHSGTTYLGHCAAVYRDMKRWGFDEELARAGLFHSIYGTGIFQKFSLPLERRSDVRALAGERVERLAYLNCAIDYDSFDREVMRGTPPYRMIDRYTGQEIEIAPKDFEALLKIQLVDRLEQVPRSKKFDYRREAYRAMAERLGPDALAAFERVYAEEGVASA
jgi:(p)ppGpp synthase/HD superfamily hydrolase